MMWGRGNVGQSRENNEERLGVKKGMQEMIKK